MVLKGVSVFKVDDEEKVVSVARLSDVGETEGASEDGTVNSQDNVEK